MNKLKHCLAYLLTCVMLFSMIPTQATAAQKPHATFSAGTDITTLDNAITLATYYKSIGALKVRTVKDFIVSTADREYTVTNTSEEKGCYVVVRVTKYTATTAGDIREGTQYPVKNEADWKELPSDDALVYLSSFGGQETVYLSTDNRWLGGITYQQAHRIAKGKSVTFTLPEAEEDDIFSIAFEYIYKDTSDRETIGTESYLVFVDTDGIFPEGEVAEPVKDFEFPTYNELPYCDPLPLTAIYSEKQMDGTSYTFKTFLTTGSGILVTAPADQEYTVVNTGYRNLTISLLLFESKPASELRQKYYKEDIHRFGEKELPTDDTLIPFCYETINTTYYLTAEGVFQKNFSSKNNRRILRVAPGETVHFTLPEAKDGQFYRLTIECEGIDLPRQFSILIGSSVPEVSYISPFTDVPHRSYFASPVEWAVENKITTGTTETTFSPNDTCTKAQILTFLWRANGEIAPTIENPFSDVTEASYYYQAALWAYENGLVEGDTFASSTPCTRAMTVTYLWKLAGKPTATTTCDFIDVDTSAEYAQAVAWCVEQEITTGTTQTTFSPDNICTRAQIVTLLYRALVK